jgi:hypothetical protein
MSFFLVFSWLSSAVSPLAATTEGGLRRRHVLWLWRFFYSFL